MVNVVEMDIALYEVAHVVDMVVIVNITINVYGTSCGTGS